MTPGKAALIAAAFATLAPINASAAFVDHQAIRACFARAQFLLTQNSGDMIAANRALIAERAAKGWRVRGDVYVEEAASSGEFHLDCVASEDGIAVNIMTRADLQPARQ